MTETFSFQSGGVALRAFEPADAPALCAYLNEPALAGRRHVPEGAPDLVPLAARQVEGILERWQKEERAWTLAVTETRSGTLVGHAHADWEWDPHSPAASVVIAPAHQRRGLGSAALGVVLSFLFLETPAHAVSVWVASWNAPALEFTRRSGFADAGRRPRAGIHAGAYVDEFAFDLLRSEWVARRRRSNAA